MKQSERIIAYDLVVCGETIKAGTPITELEGRPWFTPQWLTDAQACGHVIKRLVGIDHGKRHRATPDTKTQIARDPLADTVKVNADSASVVDANNIEDDDKVDLTEAELAGDAAFEKALQEGKSDDEARQLAMAAYLAAGGKPVNPEGEKTSGKKGNKS